MQSPIEEEQGSQTPETSLELQYIKEYLQSRGLTYKETWDLPGEKRMRIMKEAMQYASGKLEETRSKAKLIDHLHDAAKGIS